MVRKKSDAPQRPVGRPPAFDAEAVLDRVVDLLWAEGPAALSLNDIATRLGVPKPALARMFGQKEALLCAALQRYRARTDGAVFSEVAAQQTPAGIARAYLMGYARRLAEKPAGAATGCLLAAATELTAARPDDAVAATARSLNARNRAALTQALTAAGAQEAERLATFLYGQAVALAFLSRTGADGDSLADFAERALAAAA